MNQKKLFFALLIVSNAKIKSSENITEPAISSINMPSSTYKRSNSNLDATISSMSNNVSTQIDTELQFNNPTVGSFVNLSPSELSIPTSYSLPIKEFFDAINYGTIHEIDAQVTQLNELECKPNDFTTETFQKSTMQSQATNFNSENKTYKKEDRDTYFSMICCCCPYFALGTFSFKKQDCCDCHYYHCNTTTKKCCFSFWCL